MNIEIAEKGSKRLRFSDLEAGDIYKAEGNPDLYMKVNTCSVSSNNTVNLTLNYATNCAETVNVTRYKQTLPLQIEAE